MSSILTNTSAMTALQTLRGINADLGRTQDMISTGKRVATAKDNAAIFAISKVMESDVAGFKAISESLSLGASTIAVASNASNQVGELLTEIKGKITSATGENVDRATLQNEIDQLSDQIRGIVGAAQFNGLNLLSNDGEDFDVLASLDRDQNGGVSSSFINVDGRDFTEEAGSFGTTGPISTTTLGATDPAALTESEAVFTFTSSAGIVTTADGDAFTLTVGTQNFSVLADANKDDETVAGELVAQINAAGIEGLTASTRPNATTAANAELVLSYTGTNAFALSTNIADVPGALAAAPTALAATSASTSINGATETITLGAGGGTIAGADDDEVTLNFGTDSVTFALGDTPATINTPATLAQAISTAYNALSADEQISGISITNNGDDLEITNNRTSEIGSFSADLTGVTVTGGTGLTTTFSDTTIAAAEAAGVEYNIAAGTVNEGDSYRVTIDGTDYDYIAGRNETINDVAFGLQSVIAADGPSDVVVSVNESINTDTTAATLVINSDQGRTVTGSDNANGENTGDLYGLSQIDVTTDEGARAALNNIESLIGTVTRAQADFGASERRVELQSEFMSTLIDSFKAGIGALVDTDMEAASARLQALQVQQQLAVQSLSIANQAPQTILSLFR